MPEERSPEGERLEAVQVGVFEASAKAQVRKPEGRRRGFPASHSRWEAKAGGSGFLNPIGLALHRCPFGIDDFNTEVSNPIL
jgi:hypothetical protein